MKFLILFYFIKFSKHGLHLHISNYSSVAGSQGRSLSNLVEIYFKVLISDNSDIELAVSTKLKALKGALKVSDDYGLEKPS